MTRETVNTFGLVYTIQGQDPSLKPLMLAAHQDVVPVPDAATWTYPPFSAHYDGKWLWGRGASDDKNSLTALMSALETLLGNPAWIPKRTIIFALGFDEESSGRRGAGTIGPFLEQRYGRDAMALLLDEGGMGLELLGNDTLCRLTLPSAMFFHCLHRSKMHYLQYGRKAISISGSNYMSTAAIRQSRSHTPGSASCRKS
jgi:Gly-Xaa carboxypeptidase